MAARNTSEVAKKTFEAIEGAKVIAAAVENMNPPASGGQDWVLSDFSLHAVIEAAISGLAKNLGLMTDKPSSQR